MKRIVEKLEFVRLKLDVKQQELEVRARLPKGRVSKWASGRGDLTAGQALRVADALGVGLRWLADDDAPLADWERSRGPTPLEAHAMFLVRRIGVERAANALAEMLAAGPERAPGLPRGATPAAIAGDRPIPAVEVSQKSPRRTRRRGPKG